MLYSSSTSVKMKDAASSCILRWCCGHCYPRKNSRTNLVDFRCWKSWCRTSPRPLQKVVNCSFPHTYKMIWFINQSWSLYTRILFRLFLWETFSSGTIFPSVNKLIISKQYYEGGKLVINSKLPEKLGVPFCRRGFLVNEGDFVVFVLSRHVRLIVTCIKAAI